MVLLFVLCNSKICLLVPTAISRWRSAVKEFLLFPVDLTQLAKGSLHLVSLMCPVARPFGISKFAINETFILYFTIQVLHPVLQHRIVLEQITCSQL